VTGGGSAWADAARRWIAADPDPETRAEVEALLAGGDGAALEERFAGRLAFGTAGLRAPMGAGPLRMNRLVVRHAAAGIARWLCGEVPGAAAAGVLVAHDARHRSAAFAADCAEVLAAHGLPVIHSDGPLPTPVAVFAHGRAGTAAAVVVTASHNPPGDNGLKLYGPDGAQIVPPADAAIAAAIDAVAADGEVVPAGVPAEVRALPATLVDAYVAATLARVPRPPAPVAVALTAMHGVGGAPARRLLEAAGAGRVHVVGAQIDPDPDFPTVPFPNPEEPGATDLLAARMRETGAPLGLALDPDADRVGVLVAAPEGPRQLTGDEVGALLAEWLLAHVVRGPDRLVVSSVVSSRLPARIAAAHGAHHRETLTGFKWLCRPAMENPGWTQVLAYEEALGYAIGPDVRDKDGLSAALAVAAMTGTLAAEGRTPLGLLDDLHRRHGAHVQDNFSLRDEAPGAAARRDALLGRLMAAPPAALAGLAVRACDLPAPDVLRIDLDGDVRVVVRPSGTEPKLKCYCEAREPVAPGAPVEHARTRARERLAAVRGALAALLVPAPSGR